MSDWLSNNWSVILKSYPEAEPLLYYFNTVAWVNPIIDIRPLAKVKTTSI